MLLSKKKARSDPYLQKEDNSPEQKEEPRIFPSGWRFGHSFLCAYIEIVRCPIFASEARLFIQETKT